MKARAAKARGVKGRNTGRGSQRKSFAKASAFSGAAMGVRPQSKRQRRGLPKPSTKTQHAIGSAPVRTPGTSGSPFYSTGVRRDSGQMRRARGGRTLKRGSNAERAAGVRWGAEQHDRIKKRDAQMKRARTSTQAMRQYPSSGAQMLHRMARKGR